MSEDQRSKDNLQVPPQDHQQRNEEDDGKVGDGVQSMQLAQLPQLSARVTPEDEYIFLQPPQLGPPPEYQEIYPRYLELYPIQEQHYVRQQWLPPPYLTPWAVTTTNRDSQLNLQHLNISLEQTRCTNYRSTSPITTPVRAQSVVRWFLCTITFMVIFSILCALVFVLIMYYR